MAKNRYITNVIYSCDEVGGIRKEVTISAIPFTAEYALIRLLNYVVVYPLKNR